MAFNDEFIPIRKAFSAEKSKDIYESPPYENCFDQIAGKTYKTCQSASFLTARERRHTQKFLDFSLDEFNPKNKAHSRENQKLFLQASQVLEKLNKIKTKAELHYENKSASKQNSNLRTIVIHHDKLRKLLVERSCMILLEDCHIAIKKTSKLIEDFKHLYGSEKSKIATTPIQTFNRFVSSSDISVPFLELLIKKLKVICDLHSSLNNNYQSIINLFHISIDIEFNKAILKTNTVLKYLKTDVFYWSCKCIKLFLQKVCLADPNSVSTDFLQSILKAVYIYNSLTEVESEVKIVFLKMCYIFYEFKTHSSVISFDFILKSLSYFEAKVAAERIINTLISACKKHRSCDLKRKSAIRKELPKGNTSDYCSITASESDLDQFNQKVSINFLNTLLAIIQRNQSLILKYMYAISNLESSLLIKNKNNFEDRVTTSARQTWELPQLFNKDENYIQLEEDYWTNFWYNIKFFTLKLLYEVPYHQYGDSAASTVILWPESFLQILLENFKMYIENKDLPLEARCTLDQIYNYLLIHQTKMLWDKEFCSSLMLTQSHLCLPVPTSVNQICTHPGNSLNKCFQNLLVICSGDVKKMRSIIYLPVFLFLQVTLDAYLLWLNIKTRALIGSNNLPTYLLLSSSDCYMAQQLLDVKTVPLLSQLSSMTSLRRFNRFQLNLYNTIFNQLDSLYGYIPEASIIIHKVCFTSTKETLLVLLKSMTVWKQCAMIKNKLNPLYSVIDVLSPLTEILKQLVHSFPIISAIISAVCQAFLYVLHHSKIHISAKMIQVLRGEYLKFLEWLDKLDLSETEVIKFLDMPSMTKLSSILNFIQDFISKPKGCFKRTNRITPQEEVIPVKYILSEDEKIYWQEKVIKFPLLSFC